MEQQKEQVKEQTEQQKKTQMYEKLIEAVMKRVQLDTAFRGKLRRADNEAYAVDTMEALAPYMSEEDFNNDYVRRIYGIVFAAIAKSGCTANGTLGIGEACWMIDKSSDDKLPSRFKQLLSCDGYDLNEFTDYLRPLFALFRSRGISLDYARILYDLLQFRNLRFRENVKKRWVSSYYYTHAHESEEED